MSESYRSPRSEIRAQVWAKTDGKCWYCGIQTNPFASFCIDHVIPRSGGGINQLGNLMPCCRNCNVRKSNGGLEKLRYYLQTANDPVRISYELFHSLKGAGIKLPFFDNPPFQFYFEKLGLDVFGVKR